MDIYWHSDHFSCFTQNKHKCQTVFFNPGEKKPPSLIEMCLRINNYHLHFTIWCISVAHCKKYNWTKNISFKYKKRPKKQFLCFFSSLMSFCYIPACWDSHFYSCYFSFNYNNKSQHSLWRCQKTEFRIPGIKNKNTPQT